MNLVVLAIPVFFLLIALELAVAVAVGRPLYRLADAVSDLSCGMAEQLLQVFLKTLLLAGYVEVWTHHRRFDLPGSGVAAFTACLLGVDFLYYWFHRLSHEVNFLWAAHVVHHQSEDYNLAVALRQGAFQSSFSWVFYLPLAVLGFPPPLFLLASSVDTLYQFWIHTRLIRRLGPLEWVLNTPSHHRVHHGRNPRYIDRNHAGLLIVWDRLFGTFEPEGEEPVYGITTPLRSWSPLWANLHYWAELVARARTFPRWADRIRLFVMPPGWAPADQGGPVPAPPIPPDYAPWDSTISASQRAYGFAQFLVLLGATSWLLFAQDALRQPARVAGVIALLGALAVIAGVLEGQPWAASAEGLRLGLVAAFATAGALTGVLPWAWAGLALGLSAASGLWLSRLRPVPA